MFNRQFFIAIKTSKYITGIFKLNLFLKIYYKFVDKEVQVWKK